MPRSHGKLDPSATPFISIEKMIDELSDIKQVRKSIDLGLTYVSQTRRTTLNRGVLFALGMWWIGRKPTKKGARNEVGLVEIEREWLDDPTAFGFLNKLKKRMTGVEEEDRATLGVAGLFLLLREKYPKLRATAAAHMVANALE
jgi:hypothetical protein